MKYKEFKKEIENWGNLYGYEPIIVHGSSYITIVIKYEDYVRTICAIHTSERFVMYLHWELYRILSENAKGHFFEIVTEFAATKPEDREYEETEDKDREEFKSAYEWYVQKLQSSGIRFI